MASKTVNELDQISLPVTGTDEFLVSRDGTNVNRAQLSKLPIQDALKHTYVPENNLWSTPYRQVANNCRLPDSVIGIRQAFGESQHKAGQTISDLMVEFANFASYQEVTRRTILQVVTAIEYPIRSGNIQFFTYGNGQVFGTIQPGQLGRSDELQLNTPIPKGADFSLWHFHYTNTTGDWFAAVNSTNANEGIPVTKGSTYFKYPDASKGKYLSSGGFVPYINYLFQQTVANMYALPIGSVTSGVVAAGASEFSISPIAVIAKPASDYSNNATLIIGDARATHSGGTATAAGTFPMDATLLAGVAEHAFCRDGRPFINVAMPSDSWDNSFALTDGLFNRRYLFARYVDEIVNAHGVTGLSNITSATEARNRELLILNNRLFAGKKKHTLTVPYQTTSTDFFTSLAGQTLAATTSGGNVDFLNTYRTTDPDNLYDTVYDINPVLCDTATKKWKVGARARTLQGSMSGGGTSNVVNITSGTLDPADNMLKVVINGAGASGAAIVGRLQYVSPTQGLLIGINSIQESTGVALNATTAVTSTNIYIDVRLYSNDGSMENIAGIQAVNTYIASL